ncbi:MAG TPA: hypothetical protein VLT33_26265 [Labilithrix sp.]|nr:hypothetical protein [Labilithrix sp.]
MTVRRSLLVAALAAVVAFACSAAPDPNAQVTAGDIDKASFKPVALMLGRRCGSIDFHGSRFRNFRIYGFGGLRKLPTDTPETPATTQQEADEDYDAFMSLEPGAMNDFITTGRHTPSTLTVYRKARGDEAHKGGRRIVLGDPADLCLTSWLQSVVDTASCAAASDETNPLDK